MSDTIEKVETCTHKHHGIHSMMPFNWKSKIYCTAIAIPGLGFILHWTIHILSNLFGLPCP